MKLDLPFKFTPARRTRTPYFVLLLTLLLTALATYYVAVTARAKDDLRFENAVDRTESDIQKRLETYITLLRTGSGLFAASEQVSRDRFHAYVNRLELRRSYPGIQGIGFSARIMPSEKDAFVAEERKQGVRNFAIRPDYKRAEYHSIIYLEPLDRQNKGAIGFDMFTSSVRRAAMERARDTDAPAASGKVRLIQEIDKNKQGFLIYVPVYRNGTMPKTVAQRRAALQGFIYSSFRAEDLMAGIFGKEKFPYVDFQIYDGTEIDPKNLFHSSYSRHTSNSRSYRPRFKTTETINIAGRPWSIVFASRPELDRVSEIRLVPYIAVGGVLISLVLFALMCSQVRARIAAERLAAELHSSEAALRGSQERFRRLFDCNLVGVAFWNVEGYITEANDAYLRLAGYTREEFAAEGRIDWRRLTPPEYKHLDDRAIEECMAIGVSNIYEKEYVRRDGKRVPIILGVALLNDSQHDGVAFVLDIAERKKASEALRESEERFQAFMNHSPTASSITDEDGRIVYLSETYSRIFKMASDDAIGKTVFELYSPEIASIFLENIRTVARTNEVVETVEPAPRLDGTLGDFLVYKFPILDASGQRLVGGVAIDITERKRVEEEREELLTREQAARAEAEAANRMKDEFLATLSHELRTPLNAMVGWTTLLRTRKFDETTTARALETIDRNTKALSQLIEDLLDVSRIMTGKFRIEMRPVNLASVMDAAIDAVRSPAEAKNIQINSVFEDKVILVSGDPTRLQQIAWNLLTNAIKFTPKGGRIEIRLHRHNSDVQITVTDTGQGIYAEFLPYLFERFRQADASITRKHGGLGLGLAIVRHLVELHGGRIRAQSPGQGQGSTFIVSLPLRTIRDYDNISETFLTGDGQDITRNDNDNIPIDNSELHGLWVLVVDDEPDARDLVTTVLEERGAKVTAVASAKEAFEVIAKGTAGGKPDILISDIGMPEEDGYTLIRKVRALGPEQGGRIPALALTAYARAQERERAIAAGFHIHIAKPVVPEELVAIVASLVNRF